MQAICIDRYQEMSKTGHWNCITGKYPDLYLITGPGYWKYKAENAETRKTNGQGNSRVLNLSQKSPNYFSLISVNTSSLTLPFSWITQPLPSYCQLSYLAECWWKPFHYLCLGHYSLRQPFLFPYSGYYRGPIISYMKLLKMIRVHNQLDQDIHIITKTYSSSLIYKKQKTNREDQGSIFKGVNANYFLKIPWTLIIRNQLA